MEKAKQMFNVNRKTDRSGGGGIMSSFLKDNKNNKEFCFKSNSKDLFESLKLHIR